ncbi:MAG: hypothetical protein ABFD50_01285 [Smithella sp.]
MKTIYLRVQVPEGWELVNKEVVIKVIGDNRDDGVWRTIPLTEFRLLFGEMAKELQEQCQYGASQSDIIYILFKYIEK